MLRLYTPSAPSLEIVEFGLAQTSSVGGARRRLMIVSLNVGATGVQLPTAIHLYAGLADVVRAPDALLDFATDVRSPGVETMGIPCDQVSPDQPASISAGHYTVRPAVTGAGAHEHTMVSNPCGNAGTRFVLTKAFEICEVSVSGELLVHNQDLWPGNDLTNRGPWRVIGKAQVPDKPEYVLAHLASPTAIQALNAAPAHSYTSYAEAVQNHLTLKLLDALKASLPIQPGDDQDKFPDAWLLR